MTLDTPVFEAPFGGAMIHVTDPKDHRGYRHIVAWAIGLGATSTEYVKALCRQAEAENAPKSAVYKPSPDLGSNEEPAWVTFDGIGRPENREMIATYVQAMIAYEKALEAYRKAQDDRSPLYAYTLNVPANVSITVNAVSYDAARDAIAPVDGKLDHEVKQITPSFNGTMRLLLNRPATELISTDDPDHKAPPATTRRMSLGS